MLAGRNSIADAKLAQWADDGEAWLREKFRGKGLDFHTGWVVDDRTIFVRVYRSNHRNRDIGEGRKTELLFEETCKAENFVSHLTVTKILMVM